MTFLAKLAYATLVTCVFSARLASRERFLLTADVALHR